VKHLTSGIYYFRRNWYDCIRTAEIIKVTVLDNPNERNTITYKNLVWEISEVWDFDSNSGSQHLFLLKPAWPGNLNPALKVDLQMDFFNNGEWFEVPSDQAGYEFRLDCRGWNNMCLTFFIVRPIPENSSWDRKKANLKIKIL